MPEPRSRYGNKRQLRDEVALDGVFAGGWRRVLKGGWVRVSHQRYQSDALLPYVGGDVYVRVDDLWFTDVLCYEDMHEDEHICRAYPPEKPKPVTTAYPVTVEDMLRLAERSRIANPAFEAATKRLIEHFEKEVPEMTEDELEKEKAWWREKLDGVSLRQAIRDVVEARDDDLDFSPMRAIIKGPRMGPFGEI